LNDEYSQTRTLPVYLLGRFRRAVDDEYFHLSLA
jgi:hypothetical protein